MKSLETVLAWPMTKVSFVYHTFLWLLSSDIFHFFKLIIYNFIMISLDSFKPNIGSLIFCILLFGECISRLIKLYFIVGRMKEPPNENISFCYHSIVIDNWMMSRPFPGAPIIRLTWEHHWAEVIQKYKGLIDIRLCDWTWGLLPLPGICGKLLIFS